MLFFTENLFLVSNPVKATKKPRLINIQNSSIICCDCNQPSSNSTFWCTSNWSIMVRYSKPGGQFVLAWGACIQFSAPGIWKKRKFNFHVFELNGCATHSFIIIKTAKISHKISVSYLHVAKTIKSIEYVEKGTCCWRYIIWHNYK